MNKKIPTQDEIVERYEERRHKDPIGFESHEYLACLDYDHALPYLTPSTTKEEWEFIPSDRGTTMRRMKDYISFAVGKAEGKRGISANRSVMHYIAWTWLAGDRELSDEIDAEFETNYRDYGLPILKRIQEYYGW